MMDTLDRKIYFAIERLFVAYRSRQWEINKRYKVSPIMIQFLKHVANHPGRSNTITDISLEYSLTKATISDAVETLIKKGLVKKVKDKEDSRIKHILLTKKGLKITKEVDKFEGWFYSALKRFAEHDKVLIYIFLVELLRILKIRGDLEVLRTCTVCSNFEPYRYGGTERPHYCNLLHIRLSNRQIKIDCPSNNQSLDMMDKEIPLILKASNKAIL